MESRKEERRANVRGETVLAANAEGKGGAKNSFRRRPHLTRKVQIAFFARPSELIKDRGFIPLMPTQNWARTAHAHARFGCRAPDYDDGGETQRR